MCFDFDLKQYLPDDGWSIMDFFLVWSFYFKFQSISMKSKKNWIATPFNSEPRNKIKKNTKEFTSRLARATSAGATASSTTKYLKQYFRSFIVR